MIFSGRNSAVCEAFEEPHQCDDGKSSADADYFSVRHPSGALGVLCYFIFRDLNMIVMVVSIITLVLNFAVSGLIIIACQGMMNGKQM